VTCSHDGSNITCEKVIDLAVNSSIGVNIKTKIKASGTITNMGTVSSSQQLESSYSNNESQAVFVLGETANQVSTPPKSGDDGNVNSVSNASNGGLIAITGFDDYSIYKYGLYLLSIGFFFIIAKNVKTTRWSKCLLSILNKLNMYKYKIAT
jgi:hypothetical protein